MARAGSNAHAGTPRHHRSASLVIFAVVWIIATTAMADTDVRVAIYNFKSLNAVELANQSERKQRLEAVT